MNPKVSIIILNWNGWRDTIECLESLYQITYPNYDVILIDNGSEDESIKKIKEYCDGKIKIESKFFEYNPENKPIKIIEYTREEAEAGGGKEGEIADLPSNRKLIIIKNERNYGFAEGNNIGMRFALKTLNPDYILLLNNDTVVDNGFLDELIKAFENNQNIGVIGPSVYLYSNPKKLQDEFKYKNIKMPIEDYFMSGCCFLIKRKILESISMLDPTYFLYCEESDFFARIRKRGYKVIYFSNK